MKGGLDVLFRTRFDVGLFEMMGMKHPAHDGSALLAASTADGAVIFVDGSDGRVVARCELEGVDDPPNVMCFAGAEGAAGAAGAQLLIAGYDDAQCRTLSVAGELVHAHSVTEPKEDGKRPRVSPIDHMAVRLDSATYVAAAGKLVHACRVSDGQLEHAHHVSSPVRALCGAPVRERQSPADSGWAYAIACADGVRLVSSAGEAVAQLGSKFTVRSLAAFGPWVAAAGMEGAIELWDTDVTMAYIEECRREGRVLPTGAAAPAYRTLRGNCGSDGYSMGWRADGGGLAAGGRKTCVFDFTGANPAHPYRPKVPALAPRAGQPDPVPRVCMAADRGAPFVAWAPARPAIVVDVSAEGAAAPPPSEPELATVDDSGGVQLWQPHGLPMRKGGVGDPSQPQRMKPQFYTFVKCDAVHPSAEAAKPCALVWLPGDHVTVAVGYFSGEIVAWRVGAT